VTYLELIENTLARIIWLREEQDPAVRDKALEDLEVDLVARLEELRRAA
jgi:hypothetical protein